MSGLHEFRLAGARRLLRENGYADLAPMLDGPPPPAPVEPARVEPTPVDPMARLLEAPEIIRLNSADGYLSGRRGTVPYSGALQLLVTALQAGGEPVEHGYATGATAERILRRARAAMDDVDSGLASLVLPPRCTDSVVRVQTRRPIVLEVVDYVPGPTRPMSSGW